MVKRLLSLLLALCMLFSLVPVTVLKAEAATGGTCGENIRWELTGKTLIISGSGDIPDFDAYEAPWADYISSGNSSGGFVTNIVIADGITSIGDYAFYGSCFVTSVTIASSVKRIGKYAFCSLELLETITIPSSVSIIDEYAFAWCYKLSQLVLPSSLEVIGVGAFYNCEKLTSVHIPANVREFGSKEFSYESGVFALCESIKEFSVDPNNSILTAKDGILFDKNMTYLIQYPLCSDNTEYIIPDGVTTIGYQSFSHCNNLKSLIIPSSVDLIQEYAFNYSPCLEKITFLGNAPEIYATGIFTDNKMTVYYPVNDSTWTADVMQDYGGTIIWTPRGPNGELAGTHGDNVTWMFDENTGTLTILGSGVIEKLFSGSSMPWYSLHEQITSVVVESGITEIPSYVFEYLEYVETISLPDTLTTLALNAFNDCGSLNNLLIPASVKTITGSSNTGYPAFIRCESLTDVYYLGTEDEWLDIPDAEHVVNNYADMTMHYLVLHEDPPTCTESGTQSYYSFDDSSVYPNMYDLEKNIITELDEIPALNHTWDDGTVCKNCGAIGGTCGENLTWTLDEEGTLTISGEGEMASYRDERAPWDSIKTQIRKVIIEEGITSIGDWAFLECINLIEASLPATLVEICFGAFQLCENLKSITIPDGVTSIGAQAFVECNSLKEVEIPGSVQAIGKQAFSAIGIEKVTLNEGLVSIGEEAFCGCALSELTIPSTVREIGYRAFCDPFAEPHNKISSVIIPEGVVTIGKQAFWNCEALEYVSLPSTVTNIGYGAFGMCPNLTYIELASGNQAYVIQDNVIFTADGKTIHTVAGGKTGTYSIPETVTTIADYAFTECVNLTEITIPNSIDNVGIWVFNGCASLKTITVPDSLTIIPYRMFACCDNLKTVKLPDTITSVEGEAFAFCNRLEHVNIPDTVTSLGQSAFRDCTSLQEINIPEGITVLPYWLFACCESLTSVTIPASVSKIEFDAFRDCYGLKTIIFMGNAPAFSSNVFWKTIANAYYPTNNSTWTSAKRQNYGGTITWIAGTPCDNGHSYDNGVVTVDPTCTEDGVMTFICGTCGHTFTEIIESLGHDYVNGSCSRCSEIDSNYVGVVATGWSGNTTWILRENGVLTFSGTGNMKNYSYSGGQPWAMYSDLITSVIIENGVTSVGDCAFKGLTKLENVTLPASGLTKIGEAAFYGCTSLKAISLPDGLYTVNDYTFKGCSALEDVRLPKTLVKVGQGAFENCTSLDYIFIPGDTEIIGSWSFKGCTGLLEVDMQWADATEIREGAFKNCSSLTEIILPANIQKLGDSAFYGIGATKFAVPETVTEVGPWCFARAYSLSVIRFEGNAPTIGEGAFNKIFLTAYYPSGDATWTPNIMQNYGGSITWKEN